MYSNPCSWNNWGSGKDAFTHEGGSNLYYFQPSVEVDNTFKSWVPISLLFTANDKKHAADIIERMLIFRQAILDKEEVNPNYTTSKDYAPDLIRILLNNKDKWVIYEANKGQFYKVGWADNDTIL